MLVNWNANGLSILSAAERARVEAFTSPSSLPISTGAGQLTIDSTNTLFVATTAGTRIVGTAGVAQATAPPTGTTASHVDIVVDTSVSAGPEQDWKGNRARWFMGVDVANSPTSRDFVLLGQRGSYTFSDGGTTNGSPTLTSTADGGFTTALIGAEVDGPGIPPGTTVSAVGSTTSLTMSANATATASPITVNVTRSNSLDQVYVKHRGSLAPTVGVGVTPPDGSARLQVAASDAENALGTARFRVGPTQSGKAIVVHDSVPTDQWWIDASFFMSSPTGVQVQAEPSASGHAVILADNAKANQYGFDLPTGSGGVLRLRYETGPANIFDAGTDGSFRLLGTKIGFFGAAVAVKPTVTGSRGGNAALASLLTALAGLGLITDSTTA